MNEQGLKGVQTVEEVSWKQTYHQQINSDKIALIKSLSTLASCRKPGGRESCNPASRDTILDGSRSILMATEKSDKVCGFNSAAARQQSRAVQLLTHQRVTNADGWQNVIDLLDYCH